MWVVSALHKAGGDEHSGPGGGPEALPPSLYAPVQLQGATMV